MPVVRHRARETAVIRPAHTKRERTNMAIVDVKVPQLSESVAEATLLQWKKKAGEAVAHGAILIESETGKVVRELPAPSAGVLAEIVVADGGTVAAEQVIAKSGSEGRAGAPAAATA